MTRKTPIVDGNACIGAGQCEVAAPDTFEINDDGISEVIDPEGDEPAAIDKAIDTCPVQAIALRE